MINLIKNELLKIINKKSTYVLITISLFYLLLTTIIYKNNLIDIDYDLKDLLINFFDEYELLIIIVISFVCSNILIEEYKGTIKQLLMVPYSRTKILLSKYVTIGLILIMYLSILIILQFTFGIIMLDSNIDVFIGEYKIFSYFLLLVLSKIPLFLFIISFILLLSTFINNGLMTIIMTLSIYILSPLINNLSYKIDILKHFITKHYDFSLYIFDKTYLYRSIGIYILYFLFIIILSILIFNKKEIKNI